MTGECTPGSPAEIVSLFRDEAALYARLEACAVRQRPLIAEDDAGPLLTVLAERQRISAKLGVVGAKLAPVRRVWDTLRSRLAPVQRAEVEALARSTAACLRRVIERDDQDARMLSARRQWAARGMRQAHSAGAALSAYRTPSAPGQGQGRLDEAS